MKRRAYLMLLASGLGTLCFAQSHSDRWSVIDHQTIQKTLGLSGQPMRLVVDNLNGYVHVTGVSGSQVRVTAHETIHAETESDLNQAKSEVKLEMTEEPGTVSVTYQAPWRCNGNCNGCCSERKHFYEVTYDIDVEVPRQARVALSDVNGQIQLHGTDGDFDVHGVNGAVQMTDLGGSGDVHTVNGPLSAAFVKDPARPSSFATVNGAIDVYFPPSLSADLKFSTLHGGVYSDFDVAPLPVSVNGERRDGKFVYRSNGMRQARIGRGGPELSFHTVNGGIRIHRQ